MSEYNKTNYETIKPFEPTNEIEQGYLVDYVAYRYDTQFLRKGIHYNQLNPEQIKELEESGDIDTELSVEARSIDTQVMNRPTTKLIIQNLMENGIKDADGQTIGKTIIFARNHDHAAFILSIIDFFIYSTFSFCIVFHKSYFIISFIICTSISIL